MWPFSTENVPTDCHKAIDTLATAIQNVLKKQEDLNKKFELLKKYHKREHTKIKQLDQQFRAQFNALNERAATAPPEKLVNSDNENFVTSDEAAGGLLSDDDDETISQAPPVPDNQARSQPFRKSINTDTQVESASDASSQASTQPSTNINQPRAQAHKPGAQQSTRNCAQQIGGGSKPKWFCKFCNKAGHTDAYCEARKANMHALMQSAATQSSSSDLQNRVTPPSTSETLTTSTSEFGDTGSENMNRGGINRSLFSSRH
ncbi:unnamed protein product [Orchesella dallaii]|uniref:CCHC-type domain-containing protein n=1 Tax=Orchesella dallaii TaxID=48710 RepID=A0ABP1Q1K3_9HEXA